MAKHSHDWQSSHYTAEGNHVLFCAECGEKKEVPTSIDEAVEVHMATRSHPADGWDPSWTDEEARAALTEYFEEVK